MNGYDFGPGIELNSLGCCCSGVCESCQEDKYIPRLGIRKVNRESFKTFVSIFIIFSKSLRFFKILAF